MSPDNTVERKSRESNKRKPRAPREPGVEGDDVEIVINNPMLNPKRVNWGNPNSIRLNEATGLWELSGKADDAVIPCATGQSPAERPHSIMIERKDPS